MTLQWEEMWTRFIDWYRDSNTLISMEKSVLLPGDLETPPWLVTMIPRRLKVISKMSIHKNDL
jgi:hypothetical protein